MVVRICNPNYLGSKDRGITTPGKVSKTLKKKKLLGAQGGKVFAYQA
jgi:hypothetical protein